MFQDVRRLAIVPDITCLPLRFHHGWFGPSATAAIPKGCADTFICDADAPYHGLKSWDDFFTRRFRDGVRPVQFLDNDSSIVNDACESTVYNIFAQSHAPQWSPRTQIPRWDSVFLSNLNYHRWHSSVNGKIVKQSWCQIPTTPNPRRSVFLPPKVLTPPASSARSHSSPPSLLEHSSSSKPQIRRLA